MKKLTVIIVACAVAGMFCPKTVRSQSTVVINPDKTMSINGKKTFPQLMYTICSNPAATGSICLNNLQTNSVYDADIMTYATVTIPQHEQAGMGYLTMVGGGTGYKNNNNFFGYMQVDEPISTKQNIAALEQAYTNIKAADPNHVVIAVDWTQLNAMRNMADIIMEDGYTYVNAQWLKDIGYTRQNAIYFKESLLKNSGDALKGVSDFDGISKPVYAVIQALANDNDPAGVQKINAAELRAVVYQSITMNMKGLSYFSYAWAVNNSQLALDPVLVQVYINQAEEIKSLNDILVLPSKDYRCQFRQGTQVSFSQVLTASGSIYINGYTNFNYMLKQNGTTYYLIVLNKDSRSVTTDITIQGLTGSMTAKTLGNANAGSVPGRTLPVTNGKFTDSFAGYAAHIYEISSVATSISEQIESYQVKLYPNPSEGTAQIEFELPEKENVQVSIHNVLGEELGTVANSEMNAGIHKLDITNHLKGAGVYFVQVKIGNAVINRKLINFR